MRRWLRSLDRVTLGRLLAAPQPQWMMELRVGDMVQRQGTSSPPRVVRGVTHDSNGRLLAVDFAIKHCSWTGRCTTTICHSDFKTLGYRPTGQHVRLNKFIDKRIARELEDYQLRLLDCCDVKGVP